MHRCEQSALDIERALVDLRLETRATTQLRTASCESDNICPQGDSHSWRHWQVLGMVHAVRRKSNVLFPAAKSFVTWDREAMYNLFCMKDMPMQQRVSVQDFKKVGSMGCCYNMNEQTPHLSALQNRSSLVFGPHEYRPRYNSRPILVQQAHKDQTLSLTECL